MPGWKGARKPSTLPLQGQYCKLELLSADHLSQLYRAFADHHQLWTYMGYGPFADEAAFTAVMQDFVGQQDPQFWVITEAASGIALGQAAFLRIQPQNGSIEIGHICFGLAMQRSRIATEAVYLMLRQAFAWGYRRCEWKCDALNTPSRRAAERYGFTCEGLFRQALVVKGRNRDTAWYAIIDSEWPALQAAFEAWLKPDNFDGDGRQQTSLRTLTASARAHA